MKKFSIVFVFVALAFMAFAPVSFAQTVGATCTQAGAGSTLDYALCRVGLLLNTLIPILITLAVIYFIWGVIEYVISKTDEAKTAGRDKMIWGLIGLAVIVSIWGLVNILKATFGVQDYNTINVPCIESPGVTCP